MNNTQINRRIVKKILIILSLLLSLSFIGLFVYEYIRITPSDIYFTNLSSGSVTVSWTTKSPSGGSAIFKNAGNIIPISIGGLGHEKFFDTRDVKEAELLAVTETAQNRGDSESLTIAMDTFETEITVTDKGKYYTHHVEIQGLEPETEYSFMVGDRLLFRKIEDVDSISTIKTLSVPDKIVTPIPAYGSVLDAQNEGDTPLEDLTPVKML